MNVNFLAANVPLAKQFQLIAGVLESLSYPRVYRFTSYDVVVNTLNDLYAALMVHAHNGHCLLKGKLDRPLIDESRKDHTDPHALTNFILFDLDGIAGLNPEQFMARIGLGEVSYIVQYSASAGVKPEKGLSCHIFVLLDRPIIPSTLKAWLISLNLDYFQSEITLNKLGESLHWPIDITTCQNDKLIYITPPTCIPPSLDTFSGPRIQIINKTQPTYQFPSNINYTTSHRVETLLNSLRANYGLPKVKKLKTEKNSNELYSPNPKVAAVTGEDPGEEFTHLNLNGGDSWGYYHLTKGPYFLYNFKGEPTYKIQELLPDYWDKLQKAKHDAELEIFGQKGSTVLALRDHATDTYYNGWYNDQNDTLTLYPTSSKDRLFDFLTNFGLPKPESIPDWGCTYNPCSRHPLRVDIPNLTLNWFVPSDYMRIGPGGPTALPPSIGHLITNVIGNDPILVDHFLNWMACAYRYRLPTGTAWILQGVPGTGKGMLINEVMRPLFGQTNVAVKRMSELKEKFNEFIENSLICFIDEISIGEDRSHDSIMADLKQQITEPTITIRKMRTAARQVRNHANWVFSTNNKQPIKIEEGDRRYNVGEFCEVPLKERIDTYAFAAQIKAELEQLHFFLMSYKADRKRASTVIHNESRKEMIESAMVTADVVSRAIRNGDLEQLQDWVDDPAMIADNGRFMAAKAYQDLIKDLILTRRDYLTRENLLIIFSTTVGRVSRESAKFGQYLKHHEIILKQIKRNGKNFRGLHVDWCIEPEWLKAVQSELSLGKVAPIPTLPTTKVHGDGQA